MTRDELDAVIAAIKNVREKSDDKTASESAAIFPTMKYAGALIRVGTRIKRGKKIMKAAVDLWDTEENDPDNAPELWEEIAYREGIRIIPAIITVTTAFSEGELGWWGDVKYRSKVNANVYTPEQYPGYWNIVFGEVSE